jgi:lipid-binding SYLF domain-containing protein
MEGLKMLAKLLTITLIAGAGLFGQTPEAVQRLDDARRVFSEIMTAPDKKIPQDLLDKANCIGIIPGVKKGAFVVGAEYGKGVLLCRSNSGTGWSGPSTVRLEGGSVGFQIGGSETDIVLLVMNERGAEKLMTSEFTLGGDATVAAGPVGRSAEAETDAYMHAQILSYSRARGVFAGVSLEGATLRAAEEDNETIYGRPVDHKDVLTGKVKAPSKAEPLISELGRYSPAEG